MSRAAILPTPGDPFLLNYWFEFFEDVWCGEVDRLYVMANNVSDPDVVEYIKNRLNSLKIAAVVYEHKAEHGEAILAALNYVTEDHVMLIEDDGFVFKPGMIDRCFSFIERGDYDVIGSKRGSCGTQILKLAQQKWGIQYTGLGDQGPNFWPCYFFTQSDLLRRLAPYGAKFWAEGDMIEPFGVEAAYDQAGDTFVESSLKLRGIIDHNRIAYVPQYHVHPDDFEHYEKHQSIWDGQARWCHVGSLSSGWANMLDTTKPLPAGPTTEFERREYERRAQWWLAFWRHREPGKLEKQAAEYKAGIDRLIAEFRLSKKRIMQRDRIFGEVIHGF
ncbi:MAG: hypothetical protein WC871_02295 [Bacteroidales bacterium]|jgi:hypothetical protein